MIEGGDKVARFKASCHGCGSVTVEAREVQVVVDGAAWSGFYEFGCPVCLKPVRVSASARTLNLLALSGAALQPRPATASAPALTLDDLLDFHELLASDRWFAPLLSEVQCPGTMFPGH
jgi:hypothetical protein